MATFTYRDIEQLKTQIAVEAGIFEQEHQGAIVKIAIEVQGVTKSEKVKVTLAGPYAPTLPGFDDLPKTERQHTQERLRQWWTEDHGGEEWPTP